MNKSQKRKKMQKIKSKANQIDQSEKSESKEFDLTVYQKFLEFLNRNRLQKLKERITYFYGRNFPIQYNGKYDFKERWQDLRKQQQNKISQLYQSSLPIQLSYVIIMLINTFVIWSLTVKRFFFSSKDQDDLHLSTVIFGILGASISALIKIYLKYLKLDSTMFSPAKILKTTYWEILSLFFFIIYLEPLKIFYYFQIIIEVLVVFHLFRQARKIYKRHSFIHLSLQYEEKFKIFDSMINLIIIAHFCSLVLYAATWNQKNTSWIISVGVDQADYLTRYIYSFYFCSTTILTIGYGDISPKNIKEVAVVTIIEFFGVIVFGYLINQIGHTLSVMRKNQESLERDLRTLDRIQKFYNINESLVNTAKGYLISHENNVNQLTPEEENNLLGKLNEELRESIHFERSLSAIKSSIFFICRWSKEMQSQMAQKLQKILFTPNERLSQPLGNQRIYIIKRGKVDISIKRFGPNNRDDSRFLKRIKVDESNEISDNIYGYTAVISKKKCNLDAISSDFTSCMYISKEDFQKCVNKTNIDRQYYHEIKTNLDLSEFCQSFEAPSILDIRQHFYPSRTILIRKKKQVYSKLSNNRHFLSRRNRRMKRFDLSHSIKLMEQINDKLLSHDDEILQEYERTNTTSVRDTLGEILQEEIIKNIKKGTYVDQMREIRRKDAGSIYRGTVQLLGSNSRLQQQMNLKAKFEKSWQYGNYFPYNNLEKVLLRLSTENYMSCKRDITQIQTAIDFIDLKKRI